MLCGAGARLRRMLPFSPSTTPLQATTYLLGISLFSISFLVFLNSTISFVITDLLGVKDNVGSIVGTLGFVDEIVALIFCPAWGLLSDRLGVRWVAVCGYTIIAIALVVFVNTGGHGRGGVGGLVVARIVFALGASAAATMVTAILPVLTEDKSRDHGDHEDDQWKPVAQESDDAPDTTATQNGVSKTYLAPGDNPRCSVQTMESDVTITPERFVRSLSSRQNLRDGYLDGEGSNDSDDSRRGKKSSALAGYVGLFTGCGALVALVLFLPLPARFSTRDGVTQAQAVTYSFYVVAAVSLAVAVFVFFGLRGLRGEQDKGWRALLGRRSQSKYTDQGEQGGDTVADSDTSPSSPQSHLPYHKLLISSLRLGLVDPDIALGYLGGFVARASTVAISLFVPLYVNAFFISNGFCQGSPNDPSPELKEECRAAYVLSSILTGVAQLIALLCAPLFGYLNASPRGVISFGSGGAAGIRLPVLVATACGVIGYAAFPRLPSPEYKNEEGRGGSGGIFIIVALLGVSQIGAIVCSLGSLGRGVLSPVTTSIDYSGGGTGVLANRAEPSDDASEGEEAPLLEDRDSGEVDTAEPPKSLGAGSIQVSRVQLKGSIAGVYSWCGGAAILLLAKLGGYLFDATSRGAPFYMMAIFNAVLFVVSLGIDIAAMILERRAKAKHEMLG